MAQTVDFRTVENEPDAQCHLMPCRIENKEISIKAKEYFWPTIRELKSGGDNDQGRNNDDKAKEEQLSAGDNPILAASFRGRPLHGRKVTLPSGYRGRIVGNDPRSTAVPTKKFDQFTYWNWDALPNGDDEIMRAFQWINISKAIHDDDD